MVTYFLQKAEIEDLLTPEVVLETPDEILNLENGIEEVRSMLFTFGYKIYV